MSQLPMETDDIGVKWKNQKEGQYNTVVISEDRVSISLFDRQKSGMHRLCFKRPKNPEGLPRNLIKLRGLADCARQVRVFTEINKNRFAALHQNGWVSEYIDGRQATDSEIPDFLINLYRDHRRIVWDPHVPGNILSDRDGLVLVDVDYAVRRNSSASDEVVFKSQKPSLDDYIKITLDISVSHLWQPNSQLSYYHSIVTTLGLFYLEKSLQSEAIKNEYIEKAIIFAIAVAARKSIPVTVRIMDALLSLHQLGQLEKMEDGEIQTLWEELRRGDLSESSLNPVGLLLRVQCNPIFKRLDWAQEFDKKRGLNAYLTSVINGKATEINSDLTSVLNKDRDRQSKAARIIGMVLTNAALLLLCLIGVGAALFCWQRHRTGHHCWFFSETKTLESLRIAQTKLHRALTRPH